MRVVLALIFTERRFVLTKRSFRKIFLCFIQMKRRFIRALSDKALTLVSLVVLKCDMQKPKRLLPLG
ncbi:MAG: hypothetical protein LBL74_02685 [Bacteroidales bacterium]|jgi:hypothetical protein|nr:hypothetical protein [Bacteroidales bacterium]